MLMCMIRKLSKDWKADWINHLPELVHAFKYMRSAITWYSPHYLMFGHWQHLPVNFYCPTIWAWRNTDVLNYYVVELYEWLWEAFKEAQEQSTAEAKRQKWYYDRKANAILLEPGDLVLAKADAYKGKRKVKNQWKRNHTKWCARLWRASLHTLWRMRWMGCSWGLHQNWLFSLHLQRAFPFVWSYELSRQGAPPLP